MKILIASDIHGSSYYAKKLCEAFDSQKADMMILLGDIYNHGPRNPLPLEYNPLEVARLLNEKKEKLMVIKGNCDSEVDECISQFDFVDFGQIFVDGKKISLTHGQKFNKEHMPANAGDIMFYGHLHTSFITKVDGVIVVNTGSVALPKDNCHSFAMLENGKISIIDIDTMQLKNEYQS
ncbi:MAG: phosphodiesterase [Clostridia bacterium]